MIRVVDVVVPAWNERARIGRCLDALLAAREHAQLVARRPLEVNVVVVLDRCVDGTAEIALRHGVEVVASSAGCVGVARAVGAHSLLSRQRAHLSETWIASTDADSEVPGSWIAHMVEQADRGADLVLGTVEPGRELDTSSRRRWRSKHCAREDHPHVHGANLGIRADVYDRLGGWPLLTSGEDVELVKRARSVGLQIVRTGSIPVVTAARRGGRAPSGFSSYLRELDGSASVG